MKKRIDPGYLISLLLSVVLAFVIGAVILAIAGFSPGKAYLAMLNGAFSSARHIGDLLEYAMVLCLCGLACVLGARVGIFNVGGEGQLLLGAIVACQVGVWLDGLTPWLVLPLAALAAMAARPLPPSGFSALMQRVRPGVLMATASKAPCPSPGAGFAVVNASSMMLTSFPVAGPSRHGVLSGVSRAAGGGISRHRR